MSNDTFPSCKGYGKNSEELDAKFGMTWILNHCSRCPHSVDCKMMANTWKDDDPRFAHKGDNV